MDDEITLRDLFWTIISGWRIIAGLFFFSLALSGILSFFILPVKYEAKANIIFDKKFIEQQGLSVNSYNELISDYTQMNKIFDKLQLNQKGYTVDSLKNSVVTKVDEKNNKIEIRTSGGDPQTVQGITNLLGEQSVTDFKNRLIADKDRQVRQLEIQLKDIERKMQDNPKLLGTTDIKSGSGQVIQVPQVNPMYERLSGRWDEVNNNLYRLKLDKEYLEESIETGGKGLYIIFNKAPLPGAPVSPRKMLNIALAGIISLMMGIFIVLLMEFWRNSAKASSYGN